MEALKVAEYDRLKFHQTLYKGKTPPWKEVFRDKCIQRVRSNRGRLLEKFRGLDLDANEIVEVVMKEEWNRIVEKEKSLPNYFDKELNKDFDESEINEFLSIMQEIQNELLEKERAILEEYAASVADDVNSTVDWLEQKEVFCPLCKRYPLHQNYNVIFCKCGMRIDTQQDGLTLMHFENELHEGLNFHEKTCSTAPDFSLLQYCNISNLAITCKQDISAKNSLSAKGSPILGYIKPTVENCVPFDYFI